jgi:hypothetical protein
MATQDETAGKSRLGKVALSGALAAVSAGIGLLLTTKPKRLQETVERLSGRARDLAGDLQQRDLMGDLKENTESVTSQVGGEADRSSTNDFEARRREREKRREQRRQRART